MQFTGILDKNGKEIYEGDVVKIHYSEPVIGVVSFCSKEGPGEGQYVLDPYERGFNFSWHLSSKDMREVIGNIYEHPDLIKP